MIGVGSYRPDMAESNGVVARRACNVLLSKDENGLAHGPMPGLFVAAGATVLPGVPKGGTSIVNSAGAYSVVLGTPSSMYRMQANYTWTLLSNVFALPDGDRWSFARFGNNLHFSNIVDGVWQYDVDIGGAPTLTPGAPKARYLFPAFNSMFALDCDGDNRLMRNSALGNATIWKDKGAASQSFADGEELICGGELNGDLAIVWQRNAIRALYRRNDSKLYDAKLLYSGRGCVNPLAMVIVDGRAFFADTDGFYMINADGSLVAIGKDKVSKSFIKALAGNGLDSIEAAVDKVNTRIVFRYRGQSVTSSTVFNDCIAYDYELGEWTELQVQTSALFTMASPGITIDAMGSYGPIDSIDILVDSRVFSGGEPRLAGLDANYKFGFFDGSSLEAISESSSKIALQRGAVRSITPVTDALNVAVQVGVRERLADDIAWKPPVTMQLSGRAPVFAAGKIMTFRATIAAGEEWTTFRGFDGFEISAKGPQ